MTTGLDCSHGVNTLLSLARALLSTLAAIWLLGVQSAGAASFTSTQAGAYSDTATWGGGAEPSNGGVPAADTVSIGHAVHILNANDPNSDALTLTAGGSLESRGVSPAASSLDLSAGDGSLLSGNAAAANGATRTITLNAGSGARLTLGGGRTTTVGVGANVNVNSTYGVTLQTSSATTTGLNGTHTFNVNNNGTSLGTLTLSQAIVGTASTPDTIVKQGAGLLMLTVRPTFNASDEDRINMEGGRVGIGSAPSNMRVNFLTAGVVLNSSAVAWPSSTTLDFQQSATLYGGNTPTGDADPTWNSIFTGSGTITFDRGQFRHNLAANASSSWSGVMIAGTGGRGSVDVNNANLTPTLLTVYGATGFTSPDIASDSSYSGFLRLNTPSWTVGGLNTAGNGVNTRIGSKTSGNTRTLTINVGDALSYTYNGILANGITGDTSVLALIKSGNGAQTLSGQTYLSSYSGGTEVNGGTLIVNGGGTAVQKTSATALSSLANNNTSADVNVGATSDLYIGKRLTAIAGSAVANNVFISSITDATKIKITNRSGSALAAIAIGNTLDFEASSPTGSGNVTVNNAATLAGSGRIAGAVTLNNTTTLAPGDGGVGTLAVGGGLVMGGSVTSVFERTSAAVGDTVVVTGDLNLNGTINIASVGVLQGGDHVLMTCTGTLTDNGAVLGTTPPNTVCNLVVAGTTVKVTITLSGPEINAQGNGQNIPSGSTTPSEVDGTDFGSVLLNQTNDHVFTIQNLGSADLDLTDDPRVTVTGTDFTLLSDAATSVAAGNSTTFTVRFVPTALTTRLGTVSIAHNDNTDGENPYTFAIKGTCNTLLFTTAAPGAYDANATWTGGTTNPANGTADVVTLNHAVYVTSANHTANDALTVAAGGSLEARGVNPNAASLNLSAGNASLLSDASPRTITLNAATGARLALGGGSLTTVAKGALVGNNVAFGATLNAQSATTTILSGSHTFDVANNGTGLGTLTLSQRVNSQTASDALVKTGTGQLTLSAGANFAAGDLLDMQGGSLNLGADCGAGGAIRFSGSGQTLYPNSITLASDLDAQTAVAIDAIGGSGNNPTFNGKFTGSGTITLLGGQYRQIVNAAAGSTWNGTLILGTGGRAGVDVRSAYLTPSLVTLCGASGFTDPPIASDSVSTAFLRVETPILTVGGMSTTGNGINTRIGSRGTGVTRTLRVNVADSLSYDYAGMLANNIPGDTSILALVKTGSGTQTLSGQTYLSNYSGGTTVSNGTLVVNGGGAAVTKTTTSASVGNGSTGNFTIADTTGLYVGKPVTGFTDVFISAIVGTTVTVCNRSGASATIPATVTFGATSPTGSGAVAVRNGAGLRAAGRIGGGLVVEDGATFELGAGAATLSVGGNATFAGSAQLTFDLSSSAGGANDTVVMDGTSAVLSGNGGNIGINCGATLDKTADYVLFDLTGAGASVASGFSGQPLWVSGTPDDAGRFVIRAEGKQIVLHFTYGTVIELR